MLVRNPDLGLTTLMELISHGASARVGTPNFVDWARQVCSRFGGLFNSEARFAVDSPYPERAKIIG
jgi:hypothetical protein